MDLTDDPNSSDLGLKISPIGAHFISVIPAAVKPFINYRNVSKAELLPGLWIESIAGQFASLAQKRPPDSIITAMHDAIVLDYPAYAHHLLGRLRDEGWTPLFAK